MKTENQLMARQDASGCNADSNEIIPVNFPVPSIPHRTLKAATLLE